MSTKTTFKRVALVAVAALGLGVLTSVAPASAAAPAYTVTAYSGTGASATAVGAIAGPANFVTITSTDSVSEYIAVTGGTFTDGTVAKTVAAAGVVYVSTPTAGTISVKITAIASNGVADTATTATVVITVAAALTGSVYSSSVITETFSAVTAATAYKYTNAATLAVSRRASAAAASSEELFSFTVDQQDVNGTSLSPTYTKAVTAVLSGPGSLSLGGTSAVAPYVAVAAASTNGQIVNVYADGRAGKSTLTIAVNGVTVKTYDFTFWGAKASYTVTANANQIPVGAPYAAAYTITALDALGTPVPAAAWVAASSSTATATSATSGTTASLCPTSGVGACTAAEFAALGSSNVSVTAVAKGSSTFTVANLAVSPTITATTTIKVTGAQIAALTWAADKSTYAPGEKVTITVTAKDSDGNAVGDGTYTLWKTKAPVASLSTNGLVLPDTSDVLDTTGYSADLVDGQAAYTFYAPITSGAFTFSGTSATNVSLAVALQGLALSVSAEVANAEAQAAIDAAAEATDAANAATDAANAAAEAADAATAAAQDSADAVAALSAKVATLISALKAQLTSLTNLVIKIQKKVKA